MDTINSKEFFKSLWLADADNNRDEWDFDVLFTNYADKWFDDFHKFWVTLEDLRQSNLLEHPKYSVMNDEQWKTFHWNVSWLHADLSK